MAALHSAYLIEPHSLPPSSSSRLTHPRVRSDSVNVFYRINQEKHDSPGADPERAKQEREFKIGSIGLADSAGILMASLLAVPTEIELCRVQVARGKLFCESL